MMTDIYFWFIGSLVIFGTLLFVHERSKPTLSDIMRWRRYEEEEVEEEGEIK